MVRGAPGSRASAGNQASPDNDAKAVAVRGPVGDQAHGCVITPDLGWGHMGW